MKNSEELENNLKKKLKNKTLTNKTSRPKMSLMDDIKGMTVPEVDKTTVSTRLTILPLPSAMPICFYFFFFFVSPSERKKKWKNYFFYVFFLFFWMFPRHSSFHLFLFSFFQLYFFLVLFLCPSFFLRGPSLNNIQ